MLVDVRLKDDDAAGAGGGEMRDARRVGSALTGLATRTHLAAQPCPLAGSNRCATSVESCANRADTRRRCRQRSTSSATRAQPEPPSLLPSSTAPAVVGDSPPSIQKAFAVRQKHGRRRPVSRFRAASDGSAPVGVPPVHGTLQDGFALHGGEQDPCRPRSMCRSGRHPRGPRRSCTGSAALQV